MEVTRHFLLLGCCPCNQVGKTKAFQREKTVNFNLALRQVEKYMEKFPYSDLPRCKIVFSFAITLRFYSAYCTFGVSHGTVQLLPAIHPYIISTLRHSVLLLDRCLLPVQSSCNTLLWWAASHHHYLLVFGLTQPAPRFMIANICFTGTRALLCHRVWNTMYY